MADNLEQLRAQSIELIAGVADEAAAEEVRVQIFGRKGLLTLQLRGLKDLPAEEKPAAGAALNKLRVELESLLARKTDDLSSARMNQGLDLDLSIPGRLPVQPGGIHPLTVVVDEICDIFYGMGFTLAEGPDVELDYYNFTALNFPDNHPARDSQDTFYINPDILLRTQTSPVQVRVMEKSEPPLAIIAPGRVYRNEAVDASHSAEFFQIEGLYVDTDVSLSDLKTTVQEFLSRLFHADVEIRFRPHFFPFTEPSVEVDMRCFVCQGKGCSVCGRTGWIEIMGAGMVHPNVFRNAGYDPDTYTGFAFGLGIDRITMLRYGIDDIRLLYENDLRFLKQFRGIN
jgi:phenylalanyl-tRNA synthetase alpha chain